MQFRFQNCVNRGCKAYDPKLRERLDVQVGVWQRSYRFRDPIFNGHRVSVIAKWLENRTP